MTRITLYVSSVEHNNIAIYFGLFFTPHDINLRQVLIQKLTICPIYWQYKQYDMTKLYHDTSLGENAVLCSTLYNVSTMTFGGRSPSVKRSELGLFFPTQIPILF